ncbi:MAG TPA: DUF192 domain-containing protein [Leptolyngbyaceae cyanobacterium M65_K2018_010]|nr:DUF192 domain-containing protein [Leptolyngbyaceae cyanobacterium M65_K2018_010]
MVILSAGCAATGTPPLAEPAEPQMSQASPPGPRATVGVPRGQQLPITARTMLGGQEILLEVANTPEQQSLGLMYRDPLPDNRGMLFPLDRPRPVTFWMKNVPVPLDMVFIYQGTIREILAEVPPCPGDPCPTYGPGRQPIDQVLELRAGRAAELGLSLGDRVEIEPVEAE